MLKGDDPVLLRLYGINLMVLRSQPKSLENHRSNNCHCTVVVHISVLWLLVTQVSASLSKKLFFTSATVFSVLLFAVLRTKESHGKLSRKVSMVWSTR